MIKKERENLHKERQKLIHPIRETDERVRSKSEVIIADILNQEGIPYRYECPLQLKGWGKVYPDFTVLSERETRKTPINPKAVCLMIKEYIK